jgi:hypothetical protein
MGGQSSNAGNQATASILSCHVCFGIHHASSLKAAMAEAAVEIEGIKAAKEAAEKRRHQRQEMCESLRMDLRRVDRVGSSDPDVRCGHEKFVDPSIAFADANLHSFELVHKHQTGAAENAQLVIKLRRVKFIPITIQYIQIRQCAVEKVLLWALVKHFMPHCKLSSRNIRLYDYLHCTIPSLLRIKKLSFER